MPCLPAQSARRNARKRGVGWGQGRGFIILGLVGIFLIALVGGALVANASLSQTYSPEKAVTDYFAAQQRRDVDRMWAGATFARGDGSYREFFSKNALAGMMQLPENADLKNVKVTGVRQIDDSTRSVTLSMSWAGNQLTQSFTVRRDSSQVHWLLYPSWRIEIPWRTIHVTLPNQPGVVSVDGVPSPAANQTSIQVIMGFHRVSMAPTDILDSAAEQVDAVDATGGSASLPGRLSDAAMTAAKNAVRDNITACDPAKQDACPNHPYSAPDSNYVYYFTLPGYGNVDYKRYVYTMVGDPTAGLKLVIEPTRGKVSVSGTCAVTMTVDGSRHYSFKGDFAGTLTWDQGSFSSNIFWSCDRARA